MSTNPASPNGSTKGPSGLVIAGVGCLAIIIVIGVVGMMVVQKIYHKVADVAKESGGNPAVMVAKLAIAANPDLEIVTTDEAKGVITVREKKTGKTITMPLTDFEKGKITVKDADGKTTTLDISESVDGGGKMTIQSPDGKTVIAGGTTTLPAWVPTYPGAQPVEGSGFSSETPDGVAGMQSSTSTDSITQAKELYESKLKAAGFETHVNSLNSDGKETVSISATKDADKTSVNVIIVNEDGKTKLTTSYQGKP